MTAREKFLLQAKSKIAKYCSVGEKSGHQVSAKLEKYGLEPDEVSSVIAFLENEKFLDETRFARAFANDKLKFNHWGKNRIRFELKNKHRLSANDIEDAMSSLDRDLYHEIFREVASKKSRLLIHETDSKKKKAKLINFLVSRGFESNLIFESIESLLQDK